MVAEDVHWFDPSTLELLNSLLATADGRLLVVLTGRDGDWLRTDWPVTLFDVAPLTDEQSDALISELHPSMTDDAQRAAIRRRCDGVPFYIEHVVGELDAAGAEPVVPEALYEALFAGLHHSHADVVPVVEAAAVIGRAGDLPLLRWVVGRDAEDVDDVVTELVRARVLERRGSDGWRFRHELLRRWRSSWLRLARRDLHARAACALVDAASAVEPDWRVVAGHYEQALQSDDAVGAYQKASVNARRRGAIQEAFACLTNALNQLTGCAEGAARDRNEIAIRLERGVLAGTTQGSQSGAGPADFERCLALASTGNYQDELFSHAHRVDQLLRAASRTASGP